MTLTLPDITPGEWKVLREKDRWVVRSETVPEPGQELPNAQLFATSPALLHLAAEWFQHTMSRPEDASLQALHLKTVNVLLRAGCKLTAGGVPGADPENGK